MSFAEMSQHSCRFFHSPSLPLASAILRLPPGTFLLDLRLARHAIIYARILCCESAPVKAGAVERERPRPVGTVSKTGLGLAERMEIKTAEAAIRLTNFMG